MNTVAVRSEEQRCRSPTPRSKGTIHCTLVVEVVFVILHLSNPPTAAGSQIRCFASNTKRRDATPRLAASRNVWKPEEFDELSALPLVGVFFPKKNLPVRKLFVAVIF